jgi:hypothetical protein
MADARITILRKKKLNTPEEAISLVSLVEKEEEKEH